MQPKILWPRVRVLFSSILCKHTSPYQEINFQATDAARPKCSPSLEQLLGNNSWNQSNHTGFIRRCSKYNIFWALIKLIDQFKRDKGYINLGMLMPASSWTATSRSPGSKQLDMDVHDVRYPRENSSRSTTWWREGGRWGAAGNITRFRKNFFCSNSYPREFKKQIHQLRYKYLRYDRTEHMPAMLRPGPIRQGFFLIVASNQRKHDTFLQASCSRSFFLSFSYT
jgi:hypothetical protein